MMYKSVPFQIGIALVYLRSTSVRDIPCDAEKATAVTLAFQQSFRCARPLELLRCFKHVLR